MVAMVISELKSVTRFIGVFFRNIEKLTPMEPIFNPADFNFLLHWVQQFTVMTV